MKDVSVGVGYSTVIYALHFDQLTISITVSITNGIEEGWEIPLSVGTRICN